MIKATIMTVSIAALCICACGLIQEWKQARKRRRERVNRKRYLKRFRENQRECDDMFRERKQDEQDEERRRKKWDKQNVICHNPELEIFLNGVGL